MGGILPTQGERLPGDAHLLALVVTLGVCVRLLVAWHGEGSDDIRTWLGFARHLDANGLLSTYRDLPGFNHSPLAGLLAVLSLRGGALTGLPFAFVFKLPMIAADAVAATLLWRTWTPNGARTALLAAAAFLANPVSVLITGYHGNTDTLCAVLGFSSAYLLARSRPLLAGVALGGAINVKLIPVLLVPALFLQAFTVRDATRFLTGLAVMAVPFIPVAAAVWPEYQRNALTYDPRLNDWGIAYLHNLARRDHPGFVRFLREQFLPFARDFIWIGATFAGGVARLTRRWSSLQVGAIALALFLILLPGFGVQYTVYVVPFLFAVNLRWALVYSISAGIFLVLIYGNLWTGTWPAVSRFDQAYPWPAPLFGLFAWGTLAGFVGAELRKLVIDLRRL